MQLLLKQAHAKQDPGDKSAIKLVAAIISTAIAILLPFVWTPAGLTFQAVCALAILLWAIVWWICGIVPEYVTALIMAVLFVVICGIPTETVFGSFAGSTWWLLVAAFGLGLAMQKCGLMRRMAVAILQVFPNTFRAQTAGLIAAGTLVGPFIPSLAAKTVMFAPLSMSISDSMGFERKGKEASGMFLAMFTGIRNVGPAVVSSSVIGYALMSTLPEATQAQFDMVHWLFAMLPWFVVITVLNYIAIQLLYAPKHSNDCKKPDKAPSHSSDDAASKTQMSLHEKEMAIIMSTCVLLWITQPIHHIEAHIVAITAFVATLICRVLDKNDIKSGIAWDSLIFMGIIFGLASVFMHLGIDTWIVSMCEPLMASLAQNAYLFVLGIALMTIFLRFIIVSEIPYLNIIMAFMVPLAVGFGISPWVVGIAAYAVVTPWFAKYQNVVYLTAYYAVDGKMVHQAEMAKYCVLYMAISIIGLMISVPFWQSMGLI